MNDDKSFFFVHIDLKSEIEPFKTLIIGENILFIEDRVDCIWADFSQVVATNKLIESVIKSQRDGITILLSGQDYPVKNKSYINNYLSNNRRNFISYLYKNMQPDTVEYKERIKLFKINFSEIREDYIIIGNPFEMSFTNWKQLMKCILKRKFKASYLKFFFKKRTKIFSVYGKGSQWWAIQNNSLKIMHNYIKENQKVLENHFKYSFCPDEIFFHTIFLHLFAENLENEMFGLHYINWDKKAVSLPLTFELEDTHYLEQLNDNHLFARKFNDSKVLDWIDNNLLG